MFGHKQPLPPRLFAFLRLRLRRPCSNDSISKQPACQWRNFLCISGVLRCKWLP